MSPVEALLDYVRQAHPKAVLNIFPPLNEDGVWSINVDFEERKLVIEWNEESGFAVADVGAHNFGERPDETYRSLNRVQRRVTQLLTTDERTSPPIGVLLSRLREQRGYTQQDLAQKLGVKQASISGMESREDIQLTTLRRAIEALGGLLEVYGLFPEGRFHIDAQCHHGQEFVPKIERMSATPPSYMAERLVYETAFPCLNESGDLPWVARVAAHISEKRSVIEFV